MGRNQIFEQEISIRIYRFSLFAFMFVFIMSVLRIRITGRNKNNKLMTAVIA